MADVSRDDIALVARICLASPAGMDAVFSAWDAAAHVSTGLVLVLLGMVDRDLTCSISSIVADLGPLPRNYRSEGLAAIAVSFLKCW